MIERTYWDYSRNSFGLVQKNFLVALGAVKNFAEPGSVGRGKKTENLAFFTAPWNIHFTTLTHELYIKLLINLSSFHS